MGYSEKRHNDSYNKRVGEERLMKCGLKCKIIDYIKYDNIVVEFENGLILKNIRYNDFESGRVNGTGQRITRPREILVGMKFDKLLVTSINKRTRTSGNRIEYYYNCKCDCGENVIRSTQSLTNKTYRKMCSNCRSYEESIYNTKPELIKYFKNIEDTKTNVISSKNEVMFVCDKCGNERKLSIGSMFSRGFNCPKCSDGISYPEKFIFSLLNQTDIEFFKEKKFDWAKGKKYDFYIPSLNCIIETHGSQHYEEKFKFRDRDNCRDLSEEINNDNIKKESAIKNGIKYYIELDCRVSSMEHISNSINNSELKDIIDLEKIDFNECCKMANSSIMVDICKFWESMETKNLSDLFSEFKLNRNTISRYLKIGNEIGLCKYDPKLSHKEYMHNNIISNLNKKKVRCIELEMDFESVAECCKYLEKINGNKYGASWISSICRENKGRSYKGYTFEYIT